MALVHKMLLPLFLVKDIKHHLFQQCDIGKSTACGSEGWGNPKSAARIRGVKGMAMENAN